MAPTILELMIVSSLLPQWQIGIAGGTAYVATSSDRVGLFSLMGQHGKILEVMVEKVGYYPVEHGNGRLAFEYADASSPEWYELIQITLLSFICIKKAKVRSYSAKILTSLLIPATLRIG